MPGLALCLYLVWGLVAFGVRGAIQLQRTGDSGFRGFSGRPWSVEWCAGLLFAAAIAAGVAGPVLDLLGVIDPFAALDSGLAQGLGTGIAVIGIALTFAAQVAMGDAWRVGVDRHERTDLVTSGPFEIVRNPIFAAMLVTAFGLTLMVPNAVAICGLGALVAALELHVRVVEEPHLLAVHDAAYREYAGRVGRFVPGIGRRTAPEQGR